MCESLLTFNEATGQLETDLATSWKEVNPTTYVYNIRSGVKFWDGHSLTAQDVQYSLERYQSPKVAAYASAYYNFVKSIDVTGPLQVTVHLTKPDAQWKYAPALTSAGAIIEEAYAKAHPKDLGTAQGGIMCTGPFMFSSWTHNQSVVLKRNPNWWNRAHLPKVKQITFQVIPDESTLISALNSGAVDGTLYQFDGREAQELSGPVNLYANPSSNYYAIYFNTGRAPWNNRLVRQALAYAVDYQGIVQSAYFGLGQQIKSPVPPVLWSFDRSAFQRAYNALPNYSPNLSKAKKLMKESGVSNASGTLMVATPTDQHVALIVQQAAAEIGIKLSVRVVPFNQKTAIEYNNGPKSYDLSLESWLSDTPEPLGILYPEFDSANVSSDIAAYKNAQVDQWLNDAKTASSPSIEAHYIILAQAQIMKDVPVIPYIAADSLVPINKRLTGFTPSFFSYWSDFAAQLSGVS